VHEVVWDIPGDGLQLPSISTAKCGDTIRFRCPEHATHGIYKLEETNYNGTCPQSYDRPMIGEALSPPKKGCDFSITLTEGPDFFLTSQIPGACQKNLKVYVHVVCIKSDPTFVSGLLGNLPVLPSLRSRFSPAVPSEPAGLPAAGYTGITADMSMAGTAPLGGIVAGAESPLGAAAPRVQAPGRLTAPPSDPAVLEAAKQSGAAEMRPLLSKVAGMALAACAIALVL